MRQFPQTESDFAALQAEGLEVEYAETKHESILPDGDGWQFWAMRNTPEESAAVWRRIVTIEAVTH
jgi:hypothetical protein